MNKETIVNKDYLEAFNLGYELAKELNLKSSMLNSIELSTDRMEAMQAGMLEHSNEITHEEGHANDFSKSQHTNRYIKSNRNKEIDHDNGFDLPI